MKEPTDPMMRPAEPASLFAPERERAGYTPAALPMKNCSYCNAPIFYAISADGRETKLPIDAKPPTFLVFNPGSRPEDVQYLNVKDLLAELATLPRFQGKPLAGVFVSHWTTCPKAKTAAQVRDAKKKGRP